MVVPVAKFSAFLVLIPIMIFLKKFHKSLAYLFKKKHIISSKLFVFVKNEITDFN